jgi:hypothetical protein
MSRSPFEVRAMKSASCFVFATVLAIQLEGGPVRAQTADSRREDRVLLWVGKQQLHSEIRCVRQFVNPSKLEFREVSSWLFQRLRREQPTLRHCGPADSLDYREELWLGPVVWGQSSKEATVYFGSRFRSLVRPRISRVVVVGSGDGTSRPLSASRNERVDC